MKIDRFQRRVIAERLVDLGTDLAHIQHELWRVNSVWKDGLTPREREYLKRSEEELIKIRDTLLTIRLRCNHTKGTTRARL